MRFLLCIIFTFLINISFLYSQQTSDEPERQVIYSAKVNELYEFHGIVWHLADNDAGFTNPYLPNYMAVVDSCFAEYGNHRLIVFCQELRNRCQIGKSAVSQAASYTEIKNGGIVIDPDVCVDSIAEIDYRWTKDDFVRYVALADSFYRETNFHEFFKSQQRFYNEAEKYFDIVIGRRLPDSKWFEQFSGRKPEVCHINLGLINNDNYAIVNPKLQKQNEIALLFGCAWEYAAANRPVMYHHTASIILLHEMLHSYINPLVDENMELYRCASEKIYPHLQLRLLRNSYGIVESIPYEGFTRVATLYAAKELGYSDEDIDRQIWNDSVAGFPWTRAGLDFMCDNFHSDRASYPVIADFMPRFGSFLDSVADNLHHYTRVNFGAPTIVRVSPDTNVVYRYSDFDTFVIEVEFSDDMQWGIAFGLTGEDDVATNKFLLDEVDRHEYSWRIFELNPWLDLRTMQIRIPRQVLVDSKATGIKIFSSYSNGLGVPMERDVILKYNFIE